MRYKYLTLALIITMSIHTAIWLLINPGFQGDELRYLDQAARFIAGLEIYANGRIVNPPMLPLTLALLQHMGMPVSYLPVFSVLAITATTLITYKLLSGFCSPRWTCALSLLPALHPVVMKLGSDIMSEPYAILCAALSALLVNRLYIRSTFVIPTLLALALVLASMAMLKPLFGYTLAVALFASVLLIFLFHDHTRRFLILMSASCSCALLLCTPFLVYTHMESGKFFQWSTGTGDHLYWMSIGGEDIWGSWVSDAMVNKTPYLIENGYADEINSTLEMRNTERDVFLQSVAIQRITDHPEHFLTNIVANAGRVLFNYPYSFRSQSLFTYGYILPNMMLYLALTLSFLLLPLTWRYQNIAQVWLLGYFLVYLGGNILVGSTGRQGLVLLVPILLWLSYQIRILLKLGIINPTGHRPEQPGA